MHQRYRRVQRFSWKSRLISVEFASGQLFELHQRLLAVVNGIQIIDAGCMKNSPRVQHFDNAAFTESKCRFGSLHRGFG